MRGSSLNMIINMKEVTGPQLQQSEFVSTTAVLLMVHYGMGQMIVQDGEHAWSFLILLFVRMSVLRFGIESAQQTQVP